MIADHKNFQDTQKIIPGQVLKKPIKVVMSNGEYHIGRRSGDGARKREQENNACNLNSSNSNSLNSSNSINSAGNINNTGIISNNNSSSSSSNTKAYFGSPVPMFGGTFPCGSPFYPGPPTPPMDDWPDQETDDGNDVEFVDDERNLSSLEAAAKKFHQQQQLLQFNQQGLVFFPCGSPRLDDYLSASSSDDDDDEVCRLMFMNSSSSSSGQVCPSGGSAADGSNSINTRSRTSQRFGQAVQGQVTSSVRGHSTQARDQTNACSGVQHGRVHKKFRAIDVTSVGNQRPSLNFRKMRRSSFHRKHHRLTDRLSSQIQTALSTSM